MGTLFRALSLWRWVKAIAKGRILQRAWNVMIGRLAGRVLRRLWR